MSATAKRAQAAMGRKADSRRSTPAGAIWPGCPSAIGTFCCGCSTGDIVTAKLAALLAHGQLRTAQRRLARLVDLKVLRGLWSAAARRSRGRHAYVLTRAARLDIDASPARSAAARRLMPAPRTTCWRRSSTAATH